MGIPVIRLTIEGMQQTIIHALSKHAVQLDEGIKVAVNRYCADENITQVINKAVKSCIDGTVRHEINAFFCWGEGRKAIEAAVKETLRKQLEK